MLLTNPLLLALLQDPAPTTDDGPSMVFPLVAMAAIFWFVMIAPDRKARKQRKAMLDALHDSEDKTLEELLAAERSGVHATLGTPDAAEGILAFLEKRSPRFNQS